ncbi:acetoacetate--CoA ligase [Paraburkholderia sp. 5N]|uniref:Acetoacetate--CoA ligase n=2 Tax=Paraburkholderia elongata TaxID=2675747 RepID=A0A972NLM0_9BURK|nr:acetoacetate--CoA ligase [Paraburkholderia elongata]
MRDREHHGSIERVMFVPTEQSIAASRMSAFTAALEAHTGLMLADYAKLHAFSVREYRTFWRFFLGWCEDIDRGGDIEPVCVGDDCEHATFFPRVQLNYADNLLSLKVAGTDAPALCECKADGSRVRITRGELRERVARLASALEHLGIRSGDRIAAVMHNDAQAVVAALAVAAIGATLSSASPEMGADALLDRFAPLSPRLLFAHTANRGFSTGATPAANIAQLVAALPSLEGIVLLEDGPLPSSVTLPVHALGTLIAQADATAFVWRRFPFNQPLFIMFSSGTTGKPKCIVHGAGGTLLEHLKEHRLHTGLRAGDKLYFHTSCAWMMWNWQLSALASGVEIVTYDGPLTSVDTLWQLVASEHVSMFGTSPAYLKMCEQAGLQPARQFDLSALRAMMSTGAVLYDRQYHWVREQVGDLPLQSISGGTDIIGCFVLGNPNLPVHVGEAQCKSLALDVQAWDNGRPTHGVGQLVCVNPFPSRPLGFFGDAEGARFHKAYFAANPGVWTHGDLVEFPAHGSARMHGRFDGVLNVSGTNVGPAEVYRVLSEIPEIRDAMVVDRRISPTAASVPDAALAVGVPVHSRESCVVLLVVLKDGVALTGALQSRVRRDLARRASPAHVPDVILAVDALPVTHSGKPSEAAARDAINGLPVANAAALRNPACLDVIRQHPALNLVARTLPPPGTTREALEPYLQALWESLFCLSPIARDDNFFDLGGDSLLAAELATHVHQSTGRTISFATLLTAPTIAQLASAIVDDAPEAPSESRVLMRAGVGTPLFVAHSITGSVMECRALIGALQSPRPVYGLIALRVEGNEAAQRDVAEMARGYVEQMRLVQEHGPYALFGYSFGGLIAMEIAQQLHRAGEKIELLFMVDTYVHEHCLSWDAWLRHQAGSLARHWHTLHEMPSGQRGRFVRGKFGNLLDRVRLRLGHNAHKPAPEAVGLPPMLLQVRETLRVAMTRYRPRPYRAGPILYVDAQIPQPGRADPMLLLRRVARAGVKVVKVEGGHTDMIVEPYMLAVARALDDALRGDAPPSRPSSHPPQTRPSTGGEYAI